MSKNGHNHRYLIVQKSFYLNSRVSSRKLCFYRKGIFRTVCQSQKDRHNQDYNARKGVRIFYTAVSVSGRWCKHKTDVEALYGIHLSHKKQGNFLVIGKCYVNYQNHQNLMILTFSDTKRTMMHLFMFTNSAQRELVRIVYATEINFPCIITLGMTRYKRNAIYANFVQLLPCSQTLTDLLLSSQNWTKKKLWPWIRITFLLRLKILLK